VQSFPADGVLLDQRSQRSLLGQHGEEGAEEFIVVVRSPAVVHLSNNDNITAID